MKKQLLFGSALLLAITSYAQTTGAKIKPSGIIDANRKAYINIKESTNANKLNINPSNNLVNINEAAKDASIQNPPTNISWKLIAGSRNTFGMGLSATRPLQYNDNVNGVSFIHRCSATYSGAPVNNSGAIVAEISTNWGATWDSTCIWSNGATLARYPQGAIYNPVGNTNINNTYVVGTGPSTDGTNWLGNWYASKQLGTGNYNATASAAANAMQLLSCTATTYAATQYGPQLFSYGFTSSDDGAIHAIAPVYETQQTNCRGGKIVKGTFNAGVFTWATDSIIPPTAPQVIATGKNVWPRMQMAWNEAGTVGYALFLGPLNTATLSNRGYQPIVYKTTNSGTTWALLPGIDFNSAAMAPIKAPIAAVNSNSNLEIPFFYVGEGFDCVVDANNKLHIASTIVGTARNHVDSLTYSFSFTTSINPNDGYQWAHTPGNRPYLYDFIGDGTSAWTYKTIDSLSSEGPSSNAADPATAGFAENPWDANPTNKIEIDSRIQLGRTPNGQYITYSWSESDSTVTNGAKKWNNLPNIKTRCLNVSTNSLSPTKINVSKVAVGQGTNNPNVANRATLHYMSPTTGSAVVTGTLTDIKTPFTVTNSNPYAQLGNNSTYFSSNTLSYAFPITIGVTENVLSNVTNSIIYPNPTKNNATLAIDVKDNTTVSVGIYNLVGALVKTINANATVGANTINLDLTNLTSGIYLATVKVGNATSTKKIIIE